MKFSSTRFSLPRWLDLLIPVILGGLFLALLATLLLVGLSAAGWL